MLTSRSERDQATAQVDNALKMDQSARIIIAGHAFIQNIRRGHYQLGVDEPMTLRVGPPSTSWPWRSDQPRTNDLARLGFAKCNNAGPNVA
jgi:hypothetical protein